VKIRIAGKKLVTGVFIMEIALGARIIVAACGLTLALVIFECIRRGLIKEKYVLLWLPFAVILLFFGLFPGLLLWMSLKMHLHYITVIMLCIIFLFTGMLLYMTIRISSLREDIKALAQEIALLRKTFRDT
jgi:hypothetical protein